MRFQITPLTIILFLLLVLVLLIVFNNNSFFQREGFVSFLQSEDATTQNVIPQYNDGMVNKLYDNMFFDNTNGNLIEVDSTSFTGNVDMAGSSITNITTVPRNSDVAYTYEISTVDQKIEPPAKKLNSSKKTIIYESESMNTDKYNVLYMPWGKKTFIHVLNLSTEPVTNEASFYFNDTSVAYSKMMNGSELFVSDYQMDADENNNKDVLEPLYNTERKVYQLSQYVKYDKKNGNIIIDTDSDESLDIYKRGNSNKITINKTDNEDSDKKFGDKDKYKSLDLTVNMYEDANGGNTVMTMSHGVDTLVVLIGKDEMGAITIKNLKRFNPSHEKNKENYKAEEQEEEDEENEEDAEEKEEEDEFDLNNYILKTQIVPPVCPACPSCPACVKDVTCTNCGGNGGSGTLTNKGDSTVVGDSVSKTTGTIGKVASGTIGVVGDVASGAVGAAGNVASGTVGAVGDVASGTVGAVGDVASGAVGAAGDIVSSAVGAVGGAMASTVGAVSNVAKSGNNNNNNNNNNIGSVPNAQNGIDANVAQPPSNDTTDPYSYYGQLPSKKSNEFMPITANFSTFGK